MITNKIIPFIPKSIDYANYADKNYWLQRYENVNCSYEWYDDYETIKPIISDLNLPKRCVILNIGIGNSEFSEKMYDEGYKKSYNIDFARNVIHYMKQKNKRLRSSMIFETMNALDIEYEDEQFDIIFDKATFDCILCDIQANKKAKIYMDEIYRLLKPKGYFFMISNSEPENRNKYLLKKGYKFNILVHKIENDEKDVKYFDMLDYNLNYLKKTHYVYVCQKMEEGKSINEEILEDDDEEEEKNNEKKKLEKKNVGENGDKNDDNEKDDEESSISYIKLEEFQKVEKPRSNKDSQSTKNG